MPSSPENSATSLLYVCSGQSLHVSNLETCMRLFIYSLTQHKFTEQLLCARHTSRDSKVSMNKTKISCEVCMQHCLNNQKLKTT